MKYYGTYQEKLTDDIIAAFRPVEGMNSVYYGKTRNGKTRTATADILELLARGEIVYANWMVSFDGFDERESFAITVVKTIFNKKIFYSYSQKSFHYIDPIGLITGDGDINIKQLNRLVGVHIFIDEGQWVLPSLDKSYNEEAMDKMKLVLHGGHYCRSLNIITQRASNISKNTRSQINIWYHCVKRFDAFGFMIFQRWAIEDMKDDMPVEYIEDKEGRKTLNGDCKTYFVHKRTDKVFKAYNTHAMRAKDAIDEPIVAEVYKLSLWDKVRTLWSLAWGRGRSKPSADTPK